MEVPARESLTIVWSGEHVSGVTAYGLTSLGSWAGHEFPLAGWPAGTEVTESRLHGVAWEVVVWDVALSEWPRDAAWTLAVHDTLKQLVKGGCVLSWLGLEGYFCDPPDLFSPDCMSGGVLAAMASNGEFECPIDPDAPLQPLGDEVLVHFRRHAQGLADVP